MKAPNVPAKNAADVPDDSETQGKKTSVDTGPAVEPLNADALVGMTVKLKKMPLKVDGKPLTEIIVPVRLTEDLQEMGEAVAEDMSMLSICSAYCGVHKSIIGKLHPDDFDDLQKAVIDFLPRFIREPLMQFHTALRESLNNEDEPTSGA